MSLVIDALNVKVESEIIRRRSETETALTIEDNTSSNGEQKPPPVEKERVPVDPAVEAFAILWRVASTHARQRPNRKGSPFCTRLHAID